MASQPSGDTVPVRVALRVRPLSGQEKAAGHSSCVVAIPEERRLVVGESKAFTFDSVFAPAASQEEVYTHAVQALVDGCFQGLNATVFAYGQTGTGKTYTMGGYNGPGDDESTWGVLPRAVRDIFSRIEATASDYEYTVTVSCVELYMEKLRDLLSSEDGKDSVPRIREDRSGQTVLQGIHRQNVQSVEEVLRCVTQSNLARATGSTRMNERSSRSHLIFTLTVEKRQRNVPSSASELPQNDPASVPVEENNVVANFHFCDLAGSERAKQTANVGTRFKESVHINSGLLALGNVVNALCDPRRSRQHVPYRDSKLTRLLKDSLGGNSRTVILTCVGPSSENLEETLNTLNYASRARNIKNSVVTNLAPSKKTMQQMQAEITALRQQLMSGAARLGSAEAEEQIETRLQEAHGADTVQQLRRLARKAVFLCRIVRQSAKKQRPVSPEKAASVQDQTRKSIADIEDVVEVSLVSSTSDDDLEETEDIDLGSTQTLAEPSMDRLKTPIIESRQDQGDAALLQQQLAELEEQRKEDENQLLTLANRVTALERENADLLARLEEENRQAGSDAGHDKALQGVQVSQISGGRAKTLAPISSSITAAQLSEATREAASAPASDQQMSRLDAQSRAQTAASILHFASQHHRRIERDDTVQVGPLSSSDEDEGEDRSLTENNAENSDAIDGDDIVEPSEETSIIKTTSARGPRSAAQYQSDAELLQENESDLKEYLVRLEDELHSAKNEVSRMALSIRMKEQLIQNLVASQQEAKAAVTSYEQQLQTAMENAKKANAALADAKQKLKTAKKAGDASKVDSLRRDYESRLRAAKNRVDLLTKKQEEAERILHIQRKSSKRIKQLQENIMQLSKEREALDERLQKEMQDRQEAKKLLVATQQQMAKETKQRQQLEATAAKQKEAIDRKTKEMLALQRRLRGRKSTTQVVWLDEEVDVEVQRRMAQFQLEQAKEVRASVAAQRDAVAKRQGKLLLTKLRASQALSTDVLRVSRRLEGVSEALREGAATEQLRQEKAQLEEQLKLMHNKLNTEEVLPPNQERKLSELTEQLAMLDTALMLRDEDIRRKAGTLHPGEHKLGKYLEMMSGDEAKAVVRDCFERIVDMRQDQAILERRIGEEVARARQYEEECEKLEDLVKQAQEETEYLLSKKEAEYNRQIKFLLHQLNETGRASDTEELKRELLYYKQRYRQFKRQLSELTGHVYDSKPVSRARTEQSERPWTEQENPARVQGYQPSSAPELGARNASNLSQRSESGYEERRPSKPLSAKTRQHRAAKRAEQADLEPAQEALKPSLDMDADLVNLGAASSSEESEVSDSIAPDEAASTPESSAAVQHDLEDDHDVMASVSTTDVAGMARDMSRGSQKDGRNPWN